MVRAQDFGHIDPFLFCSLLNFVEPSFQYRFLLLGIWDPVENPRFDFPKEEPSMKLRISCVVVGFLSLVPLLVQLSAAQTPTPTVSTLPRLVRFSGTVKNLDGNPLTGVVGITFALYSEQTGGAALWLETQNVTADSNGHYTVLLGSAKPDGLPAEVFTSEQAHWVGVQVSGQNEQPRLVLVSAPYALKAGDAETLGGIPASAFVRVATGNTAGTANANARPSSLGPATSNSGSAALTVTGSGTKNFLPIWTNSTALGNSALFQSSVGNLGLATLLPTQKFEVDFGNLLVRGANNYKKAGDAAFLYLGDTSHPIEAIWNTGLAIGAFKVPEALFIQDQTGNIGVGTTSPTSKLKVVSSAGTAGAFSSLKAGSSGLTAAGGPGNASVAGGSGFIATGGANNADGGPGGVGGSFTGGDGLGLGSSGGNGIVVNGGFAGTVATGGAGVSAVGGGAGPNATGGAGVVGQGGSPSSSSGLAGPGVSGVGGISFNGGSSGVEGTGGAPAGAGVVAMGSSSDPGGDGVEAFAGSGSPTGLAGSFSGDVGVTGNLSVSGTKSFKIDHPLDPANKYLYHAAVESSEVLNLYTGNVTLGPDGTAVVQLPEWFDALNKDFRYQLTAIGGPGPGLHIAQEIQDRSFRIAGGQSGMKVSWQVTGVRQDAWEKAHPMAVEMAKPPNERGYYINPDLFGEPPEKAIDWARHPQLMKRMKDTQEKQVKQMQVMLAKPGKPTNP
jgi:hypothetical protein